MQVVPALAGYQTTFVGRWSSRRRRAAAYYFRKSTGAESETLLNLSTLRIFREREGPTGCRLSCGNNGRNHADRAPAPQRALAVPTTLPAASEKRVLTRGVRLDFHTGRAPTAQDKFASLRGEPPIRLHTTTPLQSPIRPHGGRPLAAIRRLQCTAPHLRSQ